MPNGRRTDHGGILRALLIGVAVIALAVGGIAWWALSQVRDRGYLGGAVVVPEEYRDIIIDAAERCEGVPVEVLAAQIAAESGFNPTARSSAGAKGIAQFMPSTWKQYGIDANDDGARDVWDPVDAIHSAAELNCINRRLVRKASGDRLRNTLAAYNAGYRSVLDYDGIPPFPETQAYVRKITESARTIVLQN